MKPGTKSRKLCLEIPTVNPCNDFIIDYLIRNKIKSDKQVLTKSYLYNLAIQAVRKYPLPLICEEQLAALEGFGNFFIGQVGRLIKKHYSRGRLPTQKQMEEDDQAHFQALRAKKRPEQKLNPRVVYTGGAIDRELDSPVFGQSSRHSESQRRRYYRPKRNTQPFHILQALVELKADEHAVTKGDINEILYNHGRQKIRLWYVLRQKLQDYNFIELDQKDQEYIFLTKNGRKYVQNYDKQEQQRIRRGRRKPRPEEIDQSEEQEQFKSYTDTVTKKNQSNAQQKSTVTKQKIKQPEKKTYKMVQEMQIRKISFPKNYKVEAVQVLINQKDSNLVEKQALLEKCQDLSYQFCEIQVADFLWCVENKVLDHIAIRIKESQFDEEEFKTILFRTKMTNCQSIFIIIERDTPIVKSEESKQELGDDKNQANEEDKIKNNTKQSMNFLLRSAVVAGFKVVRTQNLGQTIQFVHRIAVQLFKKLEVYEQKVSDKPKRLKKDKQKQKENEKDKDKKPQKVEEINYLGNLQKFNKKLSMPYEISTITNQIMKCIPDLGLKVQRTLLQKFPTLATLYKKTQDSGTTKQKKLFLRSYLVDQKVNDVALNMLVQILFYQSY